MKHFKNKFFISYSNQRKMMKTNNDSNSSNNSFFKFKESDKNSYAFAKTFQSNIESTKSTPSAKNSLNSNKNNNSIHKLNKFLSKDNIIYLCKINFLKLEKILIKI